MTSQKTKEEVGTEEAKEVEFYAAHVDAMLDSNIEKNRQLLTLSALVIGLLMGIFDTDELNSVFSFILWMISCSCFTFCVIITLIFFPKNAEYLRHVIEKTGKISILKNHLRLISISASITFVLGIVTLFSLVIYESKFMIKKGIERTEKLTISIEEKEKKSSENISE